MATERTAPEEDIEEPYEEAAEAPVAAVPSFFARGAPVPETVEEPRDSMSQFISRTMATVAEAEDDGDDDMVPRAPRTFTELGLSKAFLTDLLLKIIHYSGTPSATQLSRRMGLGSDIIQQLLTALGEERLVEVLSQSDLYTGNYRYRLSERGQARVAEALERSRYAGPAPVTADQYTQVMKRIFEERQPLNRQRIKAVIDDLVLSAEVGDSLARALHSGKSTILYGPSGNGKTVVLERYAQEMDGVTAIPYAIYAYGQVIRVFDPSIHKPLDEEDENAKDDGRRDRRWLRIQRPAIVLGAEMDREALDLAYDPQARFYQAPPHIKAQNGALIIDDFGRQRITTTDLLTRWLIPLERGWDSLSMVTGEKLTVPFRVQLLLGTNVEIRQLADDALLRRILYKVQLTNPDQQSFLEILRQACRQKNVLVAEGALEYAVEKMFGHGNLRPRGSYARDLLGILIESASYDGREPVLDRESFDRAFRLFIATEMNGSDSLDFS